MVTSDFPKSTLGFIQHSAKPILFKALVIGGIGEKAEICCLADDSRQ
jgi:hypothetical protein